MAGPKGKDEKEADRQKIVFVITPIGAAGSPEREHADFVLHGAIQPVFDAKGYKVERADKMADPAMINDGIFNAIFEADICIADLTFTNANVFYELGVRHTLLKPVIHIADEETRIPFDNAQHRAILFRRSNWASFEGLKAGLLAQLEVIEGDGFKVSNPITHARGRIEIAKSGDDRDQLISDLMARVEKLEQSKRGQRMLTPDFEVQMSRPQRVAERISDFTLADPSIEALAKFIRAEYSEYVRGLDTAGRARLIAELEGLLPKHAMVAARTVMASIAAGR